LKMNCDKLFFRHVLLHYFHLKKTQLKLRNCLLSEVYGDETPSERTCRVWFEGFRNGDFDMRDKERPGQPKKFEDVELQELLDENPAQTLLCRLSDDLFMPSTKRRQDKRKTNKWVLHELSNNLRAYICSSHILRNIKDPFLDRIVTFDEKWILYNRGWTLTNYLPKHKAYPKKIMLSVCWFFLDILTLFDINGENSSQLMIIMHKKLFVEQPSLVNRKGPILLRDNARPHVSQFTIREIHELGYETLKHPTYSPDLSPTDYHFFKNLDNFLREKIFRNKEDAINTFVEFIKSRIPDFYCNGIRTLVKRWKKCVESNGNYFD
ncbi:Histone-lysine N-methyltransferase SETMAR, partial [Habropoda laboriosa]